MPFVGDFLSSTLNSLGWFGLLIAIFFIFMIDAAVIPALPEIFTVAFYIQYPALGLQPTMWAVALLGVALAGELAGNGVLYVVCSRLLIRRKRMPRIIDRAVRVWADFLVVKGEKVILVNRFAPAVPFMGVFIAVCGWDVRKSFQYVAVGSLVKYSLLLTLVGYLNIAYDAQLAQWLTLVAVVIIVVISLVAAVIRRRRAISAKRINPQ